MKYLLFACLVFFVATNASGEDRIDFWNAQRVGANGDGLDANNEWFRTAKDAGIEFVRLSCAEMPPNQRDFLIGNADKFDAIDTRDLKRLKAVLDLAHQHDVKIVITMFSLPGCRWRQKNDGKFDYRLWHDESYQVDATRFWTNLASKLRDHPALVGYNILNEPAPEREQGFEEPSEAFSQWLAATEDTTADLNAFNQRMVEAIRSVDAKTPIVLDCRFHAVAKGITSLRPIDDPALLYSFHFYEPWSYVTYRINKQRFRYPDRMPVDWEGTKTKSWSVDELISQMSPVTEWASKHGVPANRILVGEFGCDRRVEGAQQYLADTVATINQHNWHWAFYKYRSGTWDGMDYELGTEKLTGKYWQARESGQSHESLVRRRANPLWDVISSQLKRHRAKN